ncbi:MAG: hypothetical protein ACOYL6_11005 [Bacteriovoracaceae bacterium]
MKFFFASFLLFTTFAQAMDRCTPHFETEVEKANHLQSWLEHKAAEPNTLIYNKYKALIEAHPQALSALPKNVVYDVLLDEEMLWTAKQMDNVLTHLEASIAENAAMSPAERLRAALTKNLEGKVPAHTIATRIDEFMNGGTIFRALGENNLAEVTELFHGGNALAPTADSILGKFLAKHGVTPITRAFPRGPEAIYPGVGQEKLVVPVDETMFADFAELMKDQHIFAHYHSPNQGTLMVLHENQVFHWNGKSNKPFSAMSFYPGTLFPTIFMSSTEAQRMNQYTRALATEKLKLFAQQPWRLNGYCAMSGYDSCTHWVANIPIGDEVVGAYTMPGRVDHSASNSINPDRELDKLPRTQELVNYEIPGGRYLTPLEKELIERVWKVPGNKQLAYVLNLGKAQERSELANPGWVAYTFLSRLKSDRAPVVFVMVENAKVPLAPDFNLQINAHN